MDLAFPTLLQPTRAKLHRGAVSIYQGLTPARIRRLLVLVMYLSMNLGLPSGFGLRTVAGPMADTCRCSAESKAAGRCCCSGHSPTTTRLTTSIKKGCCAARSEPETKSCCARKSIAAIATEEQSAAWTGACPCNTNDLPPMLLCAQPRIFAGASSLDIVLQSRDRLTTVADVPCGNRSRPSVPPPEIAIG